jgi:hypothetical protein
MDAHIDPAILVTGGTGTLERAVGRRSWRFLPARVGDGPALSPAVRS